MKKRKKRLLVFLIVFLFLSVISDVFLAINTDVESVIIDDDNWIVPYYDIGEDLAVEDIKNYLDVSQEKAKDMLENPKQYKAFSYKTTVKNNLPFPILIINNFAVDFLKETYQNDTFITDIKPQMGVIRPGEETTEYSWFLVEKKDYEKHPASTRNCSIFFCVFGVYIVVT